MLATFGLILFFNEAVRLVWGPESQPMPVPGFLDGSVEILPEAPYPVFRIVVILVGLAVGAGLYFLITRTKIGMLIRAGASNRAMVGALGVNIRLLYTLVFGLGAILAGWRHDGGPDPVGGTRHGRGHADPRLRGDRDRRHRLDQGAVIASVLIGIVEVVGRSILPFAMANFMGEDAAQTAGPAVASMLIYVLMAAVLFFKPAGLFPAQAG